MVKFTDGCEVLIGDSAMVSRGKSIMYAMLAAAPMGTVPTHFYTGTKRILMMYGVGLPNRLTAMRAHRKVGGHVVLWDLGYWDRDDHMRLSIDTTHPQAYHLDLAPATGSRRDHILRDDYDPYGPIMLVGLGLKSARMYGLKPMEWERAKRAELRQRFPTRQILWRPKGRDVETMSGTVLSHGDSIEAALKGCSLVVCRHSNVGVDACIAGIPVETGDGAAAVLYRDNPVPTPEQRAEFLRRLGWWNWKTSEADAVWGLIAKTINYV